MYRLIEFCSSPKRGERDRGRERYADSRDRDRDRDRDRGRDRDKDKDKAKGKTANGAGGGGGLDLFSKLAAINARVVGTPAVAVSELHFFLLVGRLVGLPVCLSVCLSVCSSVCLPGACLHVLSVYQSAYLGICMCLSI